MRDIALMESIVGILQKRLFVLHVTAMTTFKDGVTNAKLLQIACCPTHVRNERSDELGELIETNVLLLLVLLMLAIGAVRAFSRSVEVC